MIINTIIILFMTKLSMVQSPKVIFYIKLVYILAIETFYLSSHKI